MDGMEWEWLCSFIPVGVSFNNERPICRSDCHRYVQIGSGGAVACRVASPLAPHGVADHHGSSGPPLEQRSHNASTARAPNTHLGVYSIKPRILADPHLGIDPVCVWIGLESELTHASSCPRLPPLDSPLSPSSFHSPIELKYPTKN